MHVTHIVRRRRGAVVAFSVELLIITHFHSHCQIEDGSLEVQKDIKKSGSERKQLTRVEQLG